MMVNMVIVTQNLETVLRNVDVTNRIYIDTG